MHNAYLTPRRRPLAQPSVDEVVEYLSMPETDVGMRSEARRASHQTSGDGSSVDIRSRVAGRRGAAQDLCTALHYACCYGGHDHPAIAKAREARNCREVQEPKRSVAPPSAEADSARR